jgi:hypothetical protein
MPKNIALFIDGTWNEPAGEDALTNTNVYKLYTKAKQHEGQRTFYRKGIGTERWCGIKRVIRNAFDGAFGHGMSGRIKDVYRFLSNEYERGDNIYLFGFSRGAFAARSLAGFAEAVGILFRNDPDDNHLEEAYAFYENGTDPQHSTVQEYLRRLHFPETRPDRDRGTDLPIYFLGVWDTVGALGLKGRLEVFSAPFTEYHKTELPSNVTHARHALALHELREDFAPVLWNGTSPANASQTLQQMWFAGAHSDVGGGYEEHGYWSEAGLAWMASEASALGLELSVASPASAAPGDPVVNNSIGGIFSTAQPIVRSSLHHPDKKYPQARDTFRVHESALKRLLLDRTTAYKAVERLVADAWDEVDELTVNLHAYREFQGTHLSAARAAEIRDWWDNQLHARVLAQARTDLESFVALPQAPTTSEAEHVALALSGYLLCGGADALQGIGRAVVSRSQDRWRRYAPRPKELPELEVWIARLSVFSQGLERATKVLPDKFQEPVETWERTLRAEQQSLQSKLTEARLRAARTSSKPKGGSNEPSH